MDRGSARATDACGGPELSSGRVGQADFFSLLVVLFDALSDVVSFDDELSEEVEEVSDDEPSAVEGRPFEVP